MPDQIEHSAPDHANLRATLRRQKTFARLALPAAQREAADRHIRGLLETFLLARPPGVLAFCWPIRAEVDCRPLAQRLLEAGWQAVMPTVVEMDTPMVFRRWEPNCAMSTDPYGIPVPAGTATRPPDVVLLPLVAFDADGYRLGYGGGYFDRTLAVSTPRPLTIGVGYELAAVPTIHPEPHDIPLDWIATEAGLRRPASADS